MIEGSSPIMTLEETVKYLKVGKSNFYKMDPIMSQKVGQAGEVLPKGRMDEVNSGYTGLYEMAVSKNRRYVIC